MHIPNTFLKRSIACTGIAALLATTQISAQAGDRSTSSAVATKASPDHIWPTMERRPATLSDPRVIARASEQIRLSTGRAPTRSAAQTTSAHGRAYRGAQRVSAAVALGILGSVVGGVAGAGVGRLGSEEGALQGFAVGICVGAAAGAALGAIVVK